MSPSFRMALILLAGPLVMTGCETMSGLTGGLYCTFKDDSDAGDIDLSQVENPEDVVVPRFPEKDFSGDCAESQPVSDELTEMEIF